MLTPEEWTRLIVRRSKRRRRRFGLLAVLTGVTVLAGVLWVCLG